MIPGRSSRPWTVTSRPIASMCAARRMLGRGSGAVPRFSACRLPNRLMLTSSARGRQAASIRLRIGASCPERPGAEIKDLRSESNSVIVGRVYVGLTRPRCYGDGGVEPGTSVEVGGTSLVLVGVGVLIDVGEEVAVAVSCGVSVGFGVWVAEGVGEALTVGVCVEVGVWVVVAVPVGGKGDVVVGEAVKVAVGGRVPVGEAVTSQVCVGVGTRPRSGARRTAIKPRQ